MSTEVNMPFAQAAERWARAFASCAPLATEADVVREVAVLKRHGLLTLPDPDSAGFHAALLTGLSWIGHGSLPLGRLLEGHLNALMLVHRFGTAAQRASATEKARDGVLFGVWNTGDAEPVRMRRSEDGSIAMSGKKTFASGASFVGRPIVTGSLEDGGWQMALVPTELARVAVDREAWKPFGMEASFSFDADFTGTVLEPFDLIGGPGDFYREPACSGGAIRFAAVHAGGARRLVEDLTDWLRLSDRASDPHQAMRLSTCVQRMQEILLWMQHAGAVAEECFGTGVSAEGDAASAERMVHAADMVRTAVERNCTEMMRLVSVGVGARGLLAPHAFAHTMRDLTMYLRQPAPDRIQMRIAETHMRSGTFAATARAGSQAPARTLKQHYFDEVYAANRDPWDFETSAYEAEKYASSLALLPRERYRNALEIGCSIGVFTQMLAERCDRLLGIDVADKALDEARKRNRAAGHVAFERKHVPDEFPSGAFDLITVSEVGYYWCEDDLLRACRLIAERQAEGDDLLLVHWTPKVDDYPLLGDQVHDVWLSMPWWQPIATRPHATYRMDVLRRNDRLTR